MSEQTDHERDMQRLAVRLAQANQRDTVEAQTDARNRDQQGTRR